MYVTRICICIRLYIMIRFIFVVVLTFLLMLYVLLHPVLLGKVYVQRIVTIGNVIT